MFRHRAADGHCDTAGRLVIVLQGDSHEGAGAETAAVGGGRRQFEVRPRFEVGGLSARALMTVSLSV